LLWGTAFVGRACGSANDRDDSRADRNRDTAPKTDDLGKTVIADDICFQWRFHRTKAML